ncbi:hypothetical protein CJA_0940 [Cellvibrio japonicus Ueda107]|uniref:Uncharacterized protein n=1 Tax=Cellvibrio japonicus (strain Ueda107) TaxID=498211 RepID=B3PLB6_CELJU|nr:hypothetical protein CJA_0940 [Cellvibrio japonicus Ueda107]
MAFSSGGHINRGSGVWKGLFKHYANYINALLLRMDIRISYGA